GDGEAAGAGAGAAAVAAAVAGGGADGWLAAQAPTDNAAPKITIELLRMDASWIRIEVRLYILGRPRRATRLGGLAVTT
ncbi:MAG TPA: hypothetical protein VHO67_01750, partial [Polyangia bacterium]|nr:hypothetical protein [Polyangia bacterium]